MSSLEQKIINPSEQELVVAFRTLPSDKQHEVLDFIEFLQAKSAKNSPDNQQRFDANISFAEAAKKYIGCVDGPSDLSTNKTSRKADRLFQAHVY